MISSNYLSVFSLFKKEVLRFIKVGIQTIIGPAVSSLLFLAVFNLALGRSVQTINGVSFANFIDKNDYIFVEKSSEFEGEENYINESRPF